MSRYVAVLLLVWSAVACTPQGDPGLPSSGMRDDFERTSLGERWHNTGGPYTIINGELQVRGAKNKPLWLRHTLPHDVRVQFDVRSETPDGDIKVELFGDGTSRAEEASYTATSYVIIFGGWSNTKNIIARLDEHGEDVVTGPAKKVEQGRKYHFDIERRGSTLSVAIDGEPFMSMTDDAPLHGRGHDHFAFNNWQSELYFDNFSIEPL